MARNSKMGGRIGPLRSPQAEYLVKKGPLSVPTGANTTMAGTAPKAAPIQSPLQGQPLSKMKGGK